MRLSRLLFILISVLSLSCNNSRNNRAVVDFEEATVEATIEKNNKTKAIYIAIASMTSPKETYKYYSELIEYISNEIGLPIYIKQKKTYEEVNDLLEHSEVDFAFICSGAFVENHRKVKILVVPQINGHTSYKAYIIVNKNSNIESFSHLKGKSFAFTDPLSNTGRLYPLQKLSEQNIGVDHFFRKTIFTYGHDISIQMVNRNVIDGASVNGLIFDYLSLFHPERVENIKIVEQSEDFGIPPVVVPKSISKVRFEKFQNVFLNLHNDSLGRKILEKINIEKFVTVDEDIYKSVFQLKESVNNEANK